MSRGRWYLGRRVEANLAVGVDDDLGDEKANRVAVLEICRRGVLDAIVQRRGFAIRVEIDGMSEASRVDESWICTMLDVAVKDVVKQFFDITEGAHDFGSSKQN